MNLKKHVKTLTIIMILMTTGLAGCLGDGETEDVEQKTINIAGSSTVFPVASAWAQAYSTANDDHTVTVAGGGSGAGASKVCSTDADSVNIGDMSRGWKDSEARLVPMATPIPAPTPTSPSRNSSSPLTACPLS